MSLTGTIAANFHEGTRSEYLAQYVFSAFGTSVPVPHPEDSGIDLYCTLGEKVGRRLHVQNYYFVQVKSNRSNIYYQDEESVKWLLSHKYPFLICHIDKKRSEIEIYQTLILTTCFFHASIKSITISMDSWEKPFKTIDLLKNELKLCVGPPILRFKINKLEDHEWVIKAKKILKAWIELDQENIDQKAMGLSLFRVPEQYCTNELFEEAKSFIGNFKLNPSQRQQFYDIFFRLLSQLVHQIASEQDKGKFKIISDFAGLFTSISSLRDSWGVRLLAVAVNTGAKYLNLPMRITLKRNDGTEETPMLDIVNSKKK